MENFLSICEIVQEMGKFGRSETGMGIDAHPCLT